MLLAGHLAVPSTHRTGAPKLRPLTVRPLWYPVLVVTQKKGRASRLWAMLIARIYEALPLPCPRCGQPLKIISFIAEPKTVGRIFEHLGQPSEPPPIAPARGPPQEEFDLVDWEPGCD